MRAARASLFSLVWDGEGVEPPDSLLVWNLTQAFHCLPSDIEEEDIGEMLAAIDAGNIYHIALKMRQGEKLSPEEGKIAGEILSYPEVESKAAGDKEFDRALKEMQ